jgi:hypothetical protein
MAAVDEVRMALERTVPDFRDRSGDWAGVLERARDERKHRRWARWPVAASAAVAAAAALVLFWPAGGEGEGVIARARAAVAGGPVVHVVLRAGSLDVYDLERDEYRSVPIVHEEWYDPARGLHFVRRVGSLVDAEALSRGPLDAPEDEQFAGVATAYRRALASDQASLGAEETVQGHLVYWIRFIVRQPAPAFGSRLEEHEVAVDAETFKPRFVRVDSGPVGTVLSFQTLSSGEGDFTLRGPDTDWGTSSWSGTSSVGPRSPAEARTALQNALWLGERFGNLTLASIREVSWLTSKLDPLGGVRALELCYGSGERCAVSVTETTEPYPPAAGGHGWGVRPPPGVLALADEPGLGYVIRNGVYVTLLARSRGELIAAAEALTPIPEEASRRAQKGEVHDVH